MNAQPTNQEIANLLEDIADLLEAQDANPHRVRAYRNGADRVRSLDNPLSEVVRTGDGKALQQIPDIGEGLARVISGFVLTGRSNVLGWLQGEIPRRNPYTRVPGIGDALAERISSQLQITSLEELEQAAYDGQLAQVEGFGPRRIWSIRATLSGMLNQRAQRRARQIKAQIEENQERPEVSALLDVDQEYRRKAQANELRKIAPRRFNPKNEAWLPVWHTTHSGWDFTAMYSNTAQAHELQKTHDWVVIYYERESQEGQATVVTATHGTLDGKRVVRGQEAECERYYEQLPV